MRHGSRRRPRSQESTLASLETLLQRPTSITISGKVKQVSAGDAIILQLVQKAFAGDTEAEKILLQFLHFAGKRANRPAALHFPDTDYTRSFRKTTPEERDE